MVRSPHRFVLEHHDPEVFVALVSPFGLVSQPSGLPLVGLIPLHRNPFTPRLGLERC